MSETNSRGSLAGNCRKHLAAFVVLLVSVALFSPLTAGTVTATAGARGESIATDTHEQCTPPLSAQERAKTLRDELQALDSVGVRSESLSAVNARIARGETNMNLDHYCEARDAFESAIAVTKPALSRAYAEGTRNTLDEIDGRLAAEKADGNPDPDVGALGERSDRLREALASTASLQERFDLYRRAQRLYADTQADLPTTPGEQLVESVAEAPTVAGLAAALFLVVCVETYLLLGGYLERNEEGPDFTSRGD